MTFTCPSTPSVTHEIDVKQSFDWSRPIVPSQKLVRRVWCGSTSFCVLDARCSTDPGGHPPLVSHDDGTQGEVLQRRVCLVLYLARYGPHEPRRYEPRMGPLPSKAPSTLAGTTFDVSDFDGDGETFLRSNVALGCDPMGCRRPLTSTARHSLTQCWCFCVGKFRAPEVSPLVLDVLPWLSSQWGSFLFHLEPAHCGWCNITSLCAGSARVVSARLLDGDRQHGRTHRKSNSIAAELNQLVPWVRFPEDHSLHCNCSVHLVSLSWSVSIVSLWRLQKHVSPIRVACQSPITKSVKNKHTWNKKRSVHDSSGFTHRLVLTDMDVDLWLISLASENCTYKESLALGFLTILTHRGTREWRSLIKEEDCSPWFWNQAPYAQDKQMPARRRLIQALCGVFPSTLFECELYVLTVTTRSWSLFWDTRTCRPAETCFFSRRKVHPTRRQNLAQSQIDFPSRSYPAFWKVFVHCFRNWQNSRHLFWQGPYSPHTPKCP